jgi:hypothetical protein
LSVIHTQSFCPLVLFWRDISRQTDCLILLTPP